MLYETSWIMNSRTIFALLLEIVKAMLNNNIYSSRILVLYDSSKVYIPVILNESCNKY